MEERWEKIPGFANYEVSNTGKVRNEKMKILKPFNVGRGYLQVHLFKDGKRTKKYIHRLVAETFIKSRAGEVEVNHKDGNKHNNIVSNLEWCTRTGNLIHSCYELGNMQTKAVRCIETGIVYPSTKEAERQTGIHHTSISMCCDGRQKKTHGTHWEFVKEGDVA